MSNTNKIEKDGITCLRNFISNSEIIDHNIPEENTNISWDGNLNIFKFPNHNNKKENLKGRIPVQVKASKRSIKKKETHPVEKSDLTNYLNDGGVLFIRPIYRTTTEYDIYIRLLLPIIIKELFDEAKTESQSIPVRLEKINNIKEFEKKCFHFLENQPLQRNTGNFIDIHKLQNFSKAKVHLLADKSKTNNFFDSIFSEDSYFYAENEQGSILPIEGLKVNDISYFIDTEIKINNEIYFKQVKVSHQKDNSTHFILDEDLKIIYEKGKNIIKFLFIKTGIFMNRLNSTRFIFGIKENNFFEINNQTQPMKITKLDEVIRKDYDYYEETYKLLKLFRFNLENIRMEDLSKDFPNLDQLIPRFRISLSSILNLVLILLA